MGCPWNNLPRHRNPDTPVAGKTVRKQYEKLTAWIRSMTLKQLLDWFDCVERVEVRNRVAQYRWSTETTARDQMFLELFFDESD